MNEFYQLWMIQIREFFREPAVMFWSFLFPAGLALVLGFAFQNPMAQRPALAVVLASESALDPEAHSDEEDASRVAFEIAESLSPGFASSVMNADEADRALRRGEVRVILVVEGEKSLRLRFDPASDEAVRQQAQAASILYQRAGSTLSIQTEALSVPGSRYIDTLVPGLLAMGVMNACLWGTGWGLIGLRMKKLLLRMAASPMNPNLFFLSFAVARSMLVAVEAAFLMIFARFVFHLVPAGSLIAVVFLMLAGVLSFTGLAVLVGSRTSNTQVGNGLINAAVLPMMLLSGIFFSYHGFPGFVQPFIRVLPLTVLADGLRAIYLEGAGLRESLVPALALIAFGLVTFAAGKRLFRWS